MIGLCCSLLLLSLGLESAAARPAKHYTDLEFPPLPDLEIPEYFEFELENGIKVFLMEDHELPLVNGLALFQSGSRFEPGHQAGLAELTGAVMRSGGTQIYAPDELNQRLEQMAAAVETSISTTVASAGFEALSPDLATVFDLYTQVIQAPRFDFDQIEITKDLLRGSIARRNDDPSSIANREFAQLIYGATSPYARTVEYSTLEAISRDDLIAFHQASFRPESMVLGVVGDFEPSQTRALIEDYFGTWNPAPASAYGPFELQATLTQLSPATESGIFVVEQPQLTQSTILLGHLDGTFANPDYPALQVMNEVLNGFGGRLFNEIRSRQGLAYSVYALWSPSYDYPGLFFAGGQTQSESTVPFIQSIQTEIDQIRQQPISAAELKQAKDSVLNSFVFNFQDPSQTLQRLIRNSYYNYPTDFIFQIQNQIRQTTIDDVQRVAQEYLQPNQLVTLVVGHQDDMDPPLSELGSRITALDVTIPAL